MKDKKKKLFSQYSAVTNIERGIKDWIFTGKNYSLRV